MRDDKLDFFKGIAAISVLYIHTVFWSGGAYVPDFMRQLSLFIDVPIFFFIGGALFFQNKVSLSSLFKLILLSAVFGFFIGLLDGHAFTNFIALMFMNQIAAISLPVFAGSVWFISVFVVINIFCLMLKNLYANIPSFEIILFCVSLLYFVFDVQLNFAFLGVNMQFFFCYLFFFNLGICWYKNKSLPMFKGMFFLLVLSLLISADPYNDQNKFVLQDFKFPPTYEYIAFSMLSIAVIVSSYQFVHSRVLEQIGRDSLYYYLCQGITSSLIYYLMPHLDLFWLPKLMVLFLFNVITCFILVELTKRLIMRPLNSITGVQGR